MPRQLLVGSGMSTRIRVRRSRPGRSIGGHLNQVAHHPARHRAGTSRLWGNAGIGTMRRRPFGGAMQRIVRIAVTLIVVIVPAACGGDGIDAASGGRGDSEVGGAEESEGSGSSEGSSDLADQTIRAEDFAEGWEEKPPDDATVGSMACLNFLETPPVQDRVASEAKRIFVRGDGMPLVHQVLMRFEGSGDAIDAMDSLDEEIAGCSGLRGSDGASPPRPGPVQGGSFEPFSFAEIDAADQQSGWQMSAEAMPGVALVATVIIVQRDEVLSTLLSVSMGTDETEAMVGLATVAAGRLV